MKNYRHELKYLVTSAQVEMLKARLNGLVALDLHTGPLGMYNISSLYFDDYYNRCYYENENGTDPREKFRIRIYNHSSKRITLECKRKERGKTLKTSCPLTIEQTEDLINGKIPEGDYPELLNKLVLDMKIHKMKPVVIVEYDRVPYVCKYGNVRITFDTNVSASINLTSFLDEKNPKRPVMPVGLQLMEVKWDDYLPDFIYRALQLESLQQTAYSKYYLCRKYNMRGM